jgi:hypothetical protein
MMEAVRTFETSVDNHFKRQYIPENNSEQHLTCHNTLFGMTVLSCPLGCDTVWRVISTFRKDSLPPSARLLSLKAEGNAFLRNVGIYLLLVHKHLHQCVNLSSLHCLVVDRTKTRRSTM